MKAIKCEMCNSSDVVKDGDYYVCQACGTKYTKEAAQKLIIEGSVKIDKSDSVKNWFEIARRAKAANDVVNAQKYYTMILEELPNNWEANFYSVYYDSFKIRNDEIQEKIPLVRDSMLSSVILVGKDDSLTEDQMDEAYKEIAVMVLSITNYFLSAETNYYQKLIRIKSSLDIRNNHLITINCLANLPISMGDSLEIIDKEKYAKECCSLFAKGIAVLESELAYTVKNAAGPYPGPINTIKAYAEKVRKHNPTFKSKYETNCEKSGCYVATCVYGSYDCPQVWTLRRYRDDTLGATWYGRAFIRVYYAVSPTLVRWFGHTKWFKRMWKGKLDRMVKRLNTSGVEDTPYLDKNW